jgi:hypothetical protein
MVLARAIIALARAVIPPAPDLGERALEEGRRRQVRARAQHDLCPREAPLSQTPRPNAQPNAGARPPTRPPASQPASPLARPPS